jgi:hypothetical protein
MTKISIWNHPNPDAYEERQQNDIDSVLFYKDNAIFSLCHKTKELEIISGTIINNHFEQLDQMNNTTSIDTVSVCLYQQCNCRSSRI